LPTPGVYGKAQYTKDYWSVSIGTQVLGSKNILDKLGTVDPTQLDVEIMTSLEEVMDSGSFDFIQVERSCNAAKGFFAWVRAVRNYYYVFKLNEKYRD
jgi:hypothetical protein